MSNPYPGDYNEGHLKGEEPSSFKKSGKGEFKGMKNKEEPSSAKGRKRKMSNSEAKTWAIKGKIYQ